MARALSNKRCYSGCEHRRWRATTGTQQSSSVLPGEPFNETTIKSLWELLEAKSHSSKEAEDNVLRLDGQMMFVMLAFSC